MRGMILAAGRGMRMRNLTLNTPKPLLRVGGRFLIEYAIESFVRANIREIIINIAYLAEKIKAALGDGQQYGIKIFYSQEVERLETGGGIVQALPWFQNQTFIVMSSDIITDYPLQQLPLEPKGLAHLVMVDNPTFHPAGDFGICNGFADITASPALTFANIGIYRPELFEHCQGGPFPLTAVLLPAMQKRLVTAEYYQKTWHNIGSPVQLSAANHIICAREDLNL